MPASVKIGFIGAGKMGGALARRLCAAGHDVRVYDRDERAVEACVSKGASKADSPQGAASGAEVIFSSLPLPEDVSALYSALVSSLRPGVTCVDVSTIDPSTARRVADELRDAGIAFVACPLGKGPVQAETGEIPLFVGGPDEAIAAIMPLLNCIGNKVYRLGDVEAATVFKLVSNLLGMTHVAVLAEGYALARRVGLDPEVFAAALEDTGGSSYQSQVRLRSIIDGDHDARFAVDLALKDLRLAVDTAARLKIPTPVGSQGLAQLASASIHGFGAKDVTAIVKVVDPQAP